MLSRLRLPLLVALMALVAPLIVVTTPARAQQAPGSENYSSDEIVRAGSNFFGEVSGGLASVVEHAVAQYGLPNGYILGQQGSGAIIAGVRYGDGTLYTKNAGQHAVFFQGPSIGWDFGGDGSRVMMLVYNLPSVSAIYDRFVGINGSAYLVAGFGMTVLSRNNVYVVPIVSGVGARLGFNVGYLKFTDRRTWNPF
ncbi:hypothetical protein QO014_003430 [Kaistia dalseonensis]|uniref:DUF1134 domain-containing protein n=1 Tax=Kaistia dalseonensis TaxID=410840 RepID=A0ABU0H9S8_9HYPH|nr:hypothetical protein [Kaistia dalseonensis]